MKTTVTISAEIDVEKVAEAIQRRTGQDGSGEPSVKIVRRWVQSQLRDLLIAYRRDELRRSEVIDISDLIGSAN